MSELVIAGSDGTQHFVVQRNLDGRMWWVVLDQDRVCVSGGFARRNEAEALARDLLATRSVDTEGQR